MWDDEYTQKAADNKIVIDFPFFIICTLLFIVVFVVKFPFSELHGRL